MILRPTSKARPKTPLEMFQAESKAASEKERAAASNLIGEQFGQAQSVLGASRDVGREQLGEAFNRQAAITGAPKGAQTKMLGKAVGELERGFGQEAAGLKSQEAAARLQAEESATQRDLMRSQLALQESQFSREFAENLKTNFVNSAIALKNAGLQNADNWRHLLGNAGFLPQFYGDRSPRVSSQYQPGQMGFNLNNTNKFI